MMKLNLTLGCIVAIASIAVQPALAAGDAKAGKEVFAKKCASCHGTEGEGKDAVAKMLKVEIRHLGSKEVQSKADAEIKKTILEGTGKMKAVSGVDSKAADDVVAYLRTLKK
jgi:mono/diheme cytochrome c family protein